MLSIVSGVDKIRHPEDHGDVGLTFSLIVLAIAAIFEILIAFRPALRQFNQLRAGRSVFRTVREGRDPALLVVVFEDSAAVVGLVVAASGLILTEVTSDAVWDGIASVLIGILLAVVAWFLAVEMKALLVGEAATREERSSIRAAILSVDQVNHVDRVLTMQLAPHEILVNADVTFDDGLTGDQLEEAVAAVETSIEEAVPVATRVFIEPVDQ